MKSATLLMNSLSRFLSKNPQIKEIYCYNIKKELFDEFDVELYDFFLVKNNYFFNLPEGKEGSRLFIGQITYNDLNQFKDSYISAYFFHACFILTLNWNCMLVDWSSGFSAEQKDKGGLYRSASLESSLPLACTLTFPYPQKRPCEFFLESFFLQKILMRINAIKVGSEKKFFFGFLSLKRKKIILLCKPFISQYYIDFIEKKDFFNFSNFQIRLSPKLFGCIKEESPLVILKLIHKIGYYSLASYYNSMKMQTKFTYFEQGFKVLSIHHAKRENISRSNPTVIFASKYPEGGGGIGEE